MKSSAARTLSLYSPNSNLSRQVRFNLSHKAAGNCAFCPSDKPL